MTAQSADRPGPVPYLSPVAWQRSSRCAVNGSCVEVAALPGGRVGVRDGKIGPASPVLAFSQAEWRGFVSGVRAGQFRVS